MNDENLKKGKHRQFGQPNGNKPYYKNNDPDVPGPWDIRKAMRYYSAFPSGELQELIKDQKWIATRTAAHRIAIAQVIKAAGGNINSAQLCINEIQGKQPDTIVQNSVFAVPPKQSEAEWKAEHEK